MTVGGSPSGAWLSSCVGCMDIPPAPRAAVMDVWEGKAGKKLEELWLSQQDPAQVSFLCLPLQLLSLSTVFLSLRLTVLRPEVAHGSVS